MAGVLTYALPIIATILLAVAGMIYGTQKISAIWLVFSAAVMYSLAVCIYWQQAVQFGTTDPPFSVALEMALIGDKRDAAQIYAPFNGRWISPVPIALSLRLANLQNEPVEISVMKIEIESSKSRWWVIPSHWMETMPIPDELPVIWVNPPPEPAHDLSLVGVG